MLDSFVKTKKPGWQMVNLQYRFKKPLLLGFLLLIYGTFYAQTDSSLFMLNAGLSEIKDKTPQLSSEDLVSVASLFETGIYEAPGIISVITEDDIKAGGYRDLLDLINQIPGFSIASDVQNGISVGIRGNWAEEAKLLVMLDGMPLNELSYGSYVLAQRVPLINIQRIEIIRGAGSSKYGGTAALGVINIITKKGQQISGHRLHGAMGTSALKLTSPYISYNYGGVMPNDVEITTMGAIRQGNMSNNKITLSDSTEVNLADSSRITSAQLYLTLNYKGFKFKQFYEDYTFQSTHEPVFSLNRTTLTEAEKLFELKKLDLITTINYKDQVPWNTQYGDPKIYDAQNLLTRRLWSGINLRTRLARPYQLLAGASVYGDEVRHQRSTLLLQSGKRKEHFLGYAAFSEIVVNSKYANLNLGTRLEKYAYFDPNFAPRLSVAKKFKLWNYKFIYNQAYKLPALQNLNLDLDQSIVPERIVEIQGQLGLQHKNFNLSATYFNICIMNLIVYGYNTTTFAESYVNSGDVYTEGVELEGSYHYKKFRVSASYSTNKILSSSSPDVMRDTTNKGAGFLALPKHKLVFKGAYAFSSKYSLNFNYVYESEREGVVRLDANTDEYGNASFAPTHNLGLVFNADGFLKNTISFSLGAYNLLGTPLYYLYPFNSGYPPVMGMGRELHLAVKLKF